MYFHVVTLLRHAQALLHHERFANEGFQVGIVGYFPVGHHRIGRLLMVGLDLGQILSFESFARELLQGGDYGFVLGVHVGG